jgi:RNA polymerase sigma-70 factor (ECF subfamily)
VNAPNPGSRLARFATPRTLFGQAHDADAPGEQRQQARGQLLLRYEPVVRRYLAGALRGAANRDDLVSECVQRFSQRLLQGAFQGADPARGRFRDYLRTSLCNLVREVQREGRAQTVGLEGHEPPGPPAPSLDDAWREALMERALRALREHEQQTGAGHYTVLKLKMDGLAAEEIGQRLAGEGGKPVTAVAVRQRLARARAKLVELLREEVAQTLRDPTPERVDEELAELGLLEYCRATPEGRR